MLLPTVLGVCLVTAQVETVPGTVEVSSHYVPCEVVASSLQEVVPLSNIFMLRHRGSSELRNFRKQMRTRDGYPTGYGCAHGLQDPRCKNG